MFFKLVHEWCIWFKIDFESTLKMQISFKQCRDRISEQLKRGLKVWNGPQILQSSKHFLGNKK